MRHSTQVGHLTQLDGEAGVGLLDAFDLLDAGGDGVAQLVEVVGLELDDDVVGAGNGVNARDAGVRVLHGLDGFADALGVSYFGFDEDVSAYGHATSPWSAKALTGASVFESGV